MKKHILLFVALISVMCTSCMKPYDVPQYVEVKPSQTAYLIPLEGASSSQVKLDSAGAYDKLKVMAKRIQITKRWKQEGRFPTNGKWIPNVSLIIVERTPVTREWTADENGTSNKNEAIWVESSDSIEFSTGFNCTAYIPEAETSKFLYFYPSGSLPSVMDTEIRNKIQETVAEYAAGFDLDLLRAKKKEMIAEVRSKVIEPFSNRGISITTIGMFGGFEYKNKDIQTAIDEVFVAQQLKNVEAAKLSAMDDQKKRMTAEGEAEANKAVKIAEGLALAKTTDAQAIADAILSKATAESSAITLINSALKEAQNNAMFIEIKQLEVESQKIAKWNGTVPYMLMGAGSESMTPLIQIPTSSK